MVEYAQKVGSTLLRMPGLLTRGSSIFQSSTGH